MKKLLSVFVVLLAMALPHAASAERDRTDYSVERARAKHRVYFPSFDMHQDASSESIIRQWHPDATIELGPRRKDGRHAYKATSKDGKTIHYGRYNPKTWHGFVFRKVTIDDQGKRSVRRWTPRPGAKARARGR